MVCLVTTKQSFQINKSRNTEGSIFYDRNLQNFIKEISTRFLETKVSLINPLF